MLQQTTSPQAERATPNEWPSEVAGLLRQVQHLLETGQTSEALAKIANSKASSPWLTNAAAVCQLRLGNPRAAVDALRGLVLSGLFLRADAPVAFKVNFAIALMLSDNFDGGLRTLTEVRDEANPAVQEIREAVRRWEDGMTFRQRLWYTLGGKPPARSSWSSRRVN